MRLSQIILSLVVFTSLFGTAASMAQERDDLRTRSQKLFRDSNFAEALAGYQQLVLDSQNSDASLPEDFSLAVSCLQNLGRISEFDQFLESAVRIHAHNWRLLWKAAATLQGGVETGGFLIAGSFERGGHRGGGKWADASARDRVRSLQLLLDTLARLAADNAATPRERSDVWKQLADAIGAARFGEAWKLQDLTDLTKLPDYDEQSPQMMFGGRGFGRPHWGVPDKGAPVDAEGNPVFHHLPASWEAATSDGERWRWALDQVSQTDASRISEIEMEWALFLNSQFGVGVRSVGPVPVIRIEAENSANPAVAPRDSGVWVAHDLADTETIARLTSGVKRLSLPDEFNPIVVLKRIIARKDNRPALEMLISIRMNRHQYPMAVELLRKVLTMAGDGDDRKQVQARIDQILGNWMQLLGTSVQPAGTGAVLDLRFRNGTAVSFEASPINIDQLLTDVKAYLQSNPQELEYEKLQIENIGYMLIQKNQSKYVGSQAAKWEQALNPPKNHFDALQTVSTPLQKAGAWWVTARMADGNETRIVLWIADMAITRKRVEDGTLYYVCDAVSGAPVARADLEFFGWRQEHVERTRNFRILTSRFADRTSDDGIAVPNAARLDLQLQWLTIARTADGRLAYNGFTGIWGPQPLDEFSYNPLKVYSITDRPVYRPGHDVKYRMWVRQPRFDQDDSPFSNKNYWLQIRNPKGDVVLEQEVTTDRWAGVDGEWKIPVDATLGQYAIAICTELQPRQPGASNQPGAPVPARQLQEIGQGSFRVEEYRKPEFEVTIDAPDKPVILGEKIQARINARYYFGAPVTEARMHYRIERTKKDSRWYPIANWDWLYGPGYWWFAPDYNWYPGWNHWGCFAPIPPWRGWSPDPPEIVMEGDATIGEDGSFAVDLDTAAALREHSDSDHNYHFTAEVVDQSRRTIVGTGDVLVAREPFHVFVWTDRGHYQTGDTVVAGFQARTPDGKPVAGRGSATLYAITWEGDKPVEKELETFAADTDDSGTGSLKMVMPQAGQFRISVKVTDNSEHTQEGGYVLFVRGPAEQGRGYRFNDLELITEKREYQPGETVRLQVNTNRPDSTVLLFVRPLNGLCPRPTVLRLEGKSTTFDLPITRSDMPNIFVEALTIADGRIHSEMREIVVPPEQRVANVEVLPSAKRYRPGEEATVRLRLTDVDGRPFTGNTVISVYDASLEYIAASSIPEIRAFFWNARRYHSISQESTLQRGSGPVYLPDEVPMQELFGNDPGMDPGPGGGYGNMNFGGFGLARGGMMRAARGGMAMPAPAMAFDAAGDAPEAMAMESLALAKNGSGEGAPSAEVQPTTRSSFADTAFWVASVDSDASGTVEVRFKVPDNLTTWKVKAWTMGDGTRVGSGSSDVISSKDLIIRPQTPRFFTEKDQITLSAVVHNYLKTPKSVRVVMETEGGQLQIMGDAAQVVQIAEGGESRVDWNVQVIASGTTRVLMKALTDEESDAAEISVPVHVHGILKTESFAGVIRPSDQTASVRISVPAERIEEQSRLEIRYSPSLAGAMVDALPWLIDYPYGCTEQTLNRFLPAVVTQQTLRRMGIDLAAVQKKRTNLNAQQLGDPAQRAAQWKRYDRNPVFDDAEMRLIVNDGVKRLTEMQLSDGGWGWFSGYGEYSTPHLTSQIVHGLTVAAKNDVPLLPDVLQRGIDWLRNYEAAQLVLLREGDWRREHPLELEGRSTPFRMQADNLDALVAWVLSEHAAGDIAMHEYLYRDRGGLSIYAKALTGLVLHSREDVTRRDMLLRNIEQFLVRDQENQTAWLKIPEDTWWYWYGSEHEAHAFYLKLLLAAKPQSQTASEVVKYLLNNRRHGTYWNSTRDTALVVEALADYIAATGEDKPDTTVEVLIDGTLQKKVRITADNFFSFENVVLLQGDAVKSGTHQIELRRAGRGPVYFNAYLTNFTKEDPITAAGLEVRIQRRFFRLERDDTTVSVQGRRGQVVKQQTAKYRRIPLDSLAAVTSGELVEVELVVDSKNDYEYLLLSDRKPSGFEPDDQRSGYIWEELRAYRELRDDRVTFFVSDLARGQHSVSYRLRAETPSHQVSALPASIEGMYAPELVGNSDEFKLRVNDRQK